MKIDIQNLSQSFNMPNNNVLQDLNVSIDHNESFVVIGGSGSGKTVLMNHIIGNLDPEKGSVLINNLPRDEYLRDNLMDIGILFQEIGLFDFMTCEENVAFYLTEILKEEKKTALQKAKEMLKSVGIREEYHSAFPNEISLGMAKRVGFARTIIKQPKILMLDEPTAGLDPISSAKISLVIKDTLSKIKTTTFTITHDLKLAQSIADKIGLLKDGKFQWIGKSEDLTKTSNEYVKEFLSAIDLYQKK